ncbi:unnamed protein product [Linum trigynum]|uniref:Uncharacterized protein n=1 Tax=Linum trigynum TaxID=586398 RepID=A0AAV2CNB3_9ROSI
MATSSKFDTSSGSPDRPVYNSVQRGSHTVTQLDRSSSFRETMEGGPVLSSLPNTMRSASVLSQGDVTNFLQCLRFDPKNVAADHKASRQGDFRRHLNVALNVSVDDSQSVSSKGKVTQAPTPEEIKRVRVSLRECSVKARERMKIFSEALSVFNKFFPAVPSKKRSRSESLSNDRSGPLLSSERSVLGQSLSKMAIQNHGVTSNFELEQQKLEERTKSVVPNKRTRTSLVDVRTNALARAPGTADRDREVLRLASNGTVQTDERTLSIGVDGWEKTKMKKKRSGIKPDASASSVSTKPTDLYRDPKQGLQQRAATDTRSRLNSDSHGFRPGVASAGGVGKPDIVSQSPGLGMRSSIPENGAVLNDRRERPVSSDKERANIKSVNKSNVRDDLNSASPTSSTKVNPSVRAPRSGSVGAPKLSPVVNRATTASDWELSHCTNKPPAIGANNRKRTASNRSSSPPVAQWAGQRPQKISRTARRTNLMPIVSSNDEVSAVDTVSDISGNETGMGLSTPRRLSAGSPQQIKLKSEPLSSAALSESEESGAPEIKSRDKPKKSDEIDEKVGLNVQKVSSLGTPSRKNKLMQGEELGDGVRRQGRTGRTFSTPRSLVPMGMEKLGPAKQIRSARASSDKNESKPGRPPTRKVSDRKAYTRQKHTAVHATSDFLVASDDGQEELLAAANAAISHASQVLSCPFWRQMEQYFGCIADVDLEYLKQQANLDPIVSPVPFSSDAHICSNISNGYRLIDQGREVRCATETTGVELHPGESVVGTGDSSLCQMLLAAIISEDDCGLEDEDNEFGAYETGFEPDRVLGLSGLDHLDSFRASTQAVFNDYKVTVKPGHDSSEINVLGTPKAGTYSSSIHATNGVFSDQIPIPIAASELQYDNMRLNEKLLLEVQSIGIFPESVPGVHTEDEGIAVDICKLEEKHAEQVLKKRGLVDQLLKAAMETKEIQERELEQRAYEKLTTMAYHKYMACWGSTGGKTSNNKMAKQSALAFVKRTLERCYNFEDTGNGCFSEPMFKEMFLSAPSQVNGSQMVDYTVDAEPAKPFVAASSRLLDSRVSASTGLQLSPQTSRLSQNGDGHVANPCDMLPPVHRGSGKEDTWSNRVKKRELLLEDVGGGTTATSSGIGGSLLSSTKGKRSERDREGKGHNREILSRNGTNRSGRPALSNSRGERKSKAKPKQKTTQLSVSVNGLLGKTEHPKPTLPSESKRTHQTSGSNAKEKDGFGLDVLEDPDSLDLSNIIPGIDDDGQGQDLGSWLNIDDDGLQDLDFMGLEIPMDDLSDLNMMV